MARGKVTQLFKNFPGPHAEARSFAMSKEVTLGTPCRFTLRCAPDHRVRPQKLFTNAPCEGFVRCNFPSIDVLSVKDVLLLCADHNVISVPGDALSRSNPAICNCEYSGKVPTDLRRGARFVFVITVSGRAVQRHLRAVP
jgi:hypothetical protein